MSLIIKHEEYLDIWEAMMAELHDTINPPTRDERNLLRNMLYYVFGEGVVFEGKMATAVSNPWNALRSMVASSLIVINEHLDKLDSPEVVEFSQPRIEQLLGYVAA